MENIKKNPTQLEVEGKTVEEAVLKALSILKVNRDQIKIKVLSEEQKGLFGMQGAKPAKIRVSVVTLATPKKKP
jgi:spoIIIJ-associated protein